MSKEVPRFIQDWVGPHLPKEHIYVDKANLPEDLIGKSRLYSRKWLIHPIRRHLTHLYSEVLESRGTDVIGITGSAGKTTTKDMVGAVLSQKFRTVWSEGNIDPIYNIPQAVLHTPVGTQKLVLEMGIEYPGEMDFYVWLARPTTGVVTTIYWTHTQFLHDIEGVKKQKGTLIESLPKNGYAVLNYDDPNVRAIADRTRAKVLWYGKTNKNNPGLEVSASDIDITDDLRTKFVLVTRVGSTEVSLHPLGKHFVSLALAAAAIGVVNNVPLSAIKKGLESVKPLNHRMKPFRSKDGTLIIDDTFNANPLAVSEAIKFMHDFDTKGRKILVLGEMKELGKYERSAHAEVGRLAAGEGIDILLTLGELTKYSVAAARRGGMLKQNALEAYDKAELAKLLQQIIKPGDLVLVKGSRSMKMEEVVNAVK